MTSDAPGPTRSPIRRLSADVVEKIAAGEVVERPGSVVKELLENSADARASDIRVHVEAGGLALIRVEDDGEGIPPAELPLAVERHATSKIGSASDLDSIATLGFRGEALAAIAAVARLTLRSRTSLTDEAYVLEVAGGNAGPVHVAGAPRGTSVEVRDLFFNTPARRKFLRPPPVELLAVEEAVDRFYLAQPSISVRVTSEGGEVARYPRAASLRDALARVLGPEILSESFAFHADLLPGAGVDAVLGRPTLSRPNSLGLYLAVNGRPIQSRSLAQAVRAAFIDYLPRTRFPVGAISLTVDPSQVDVNVHPTKREVRFAGERALAEALRGSVRSELRSSPHAAVAGPAPSVLSAPPPERSPLPLPVPGSSPSRAVAETIPGRQTVLSNPRPGTGVGGTRRHPGLRLVGALFSLYWVAETADGLLLVDQHAASERVLFDEILRTGRLARQELLAPVTVELTPRQRTALDAHRAEVDRAGFEVEPFGGAAVRILAVPSYLGHRAPVDALGPLLDELASGGRPTLPEGLTERVAASIACHAAVRAGDTIEAAELERILRQLFSLEGASYACPHGRPILVELPKGRLDRWFLRAGG